MTNAFARYDWLIFVALTLASTTTAGLAAFAVGGADTFESPRALPLLLAAIWSPTVVALGMALATGRQGELLTALRSPGRLQAWAAALLPVAIAASLAAASSTPSARPVPWGLLLGMNLVMGPLGEELGWRAYLLPRLVPALGWVGAALAVGTIWALWHAPLWFVPSPQRAIPFPVFFATVLCFSVLMTAAWKAGAGSVWPMVGFHLTANVAVGALEVSGVLGARAFYEAALPIYGVGALFAAAWLGSTTRDGCPVPAS